MLHLVIFPVTILILTIIYYWIKVSDYWKKRKVIQVNGTFAEFIFGRKSFGEIYKRVYDEYPNEPYVGVFIGTKPALLIKDLSNVQTIMVSDCKNFHSRGVGANENDALSNNLAMTDNYKRWRLLRHKLTPMFTTMKLKNMYYILDKCAQDFVHRIKENPKIVKNPFDAMRTYTVSSITASVFGIDVNVGNTMDNPLITMAQKALAVNLRNYIVYIVNNIAPGVLDYFNYKFFGSFEERFIGAIRRAVENRKKTGEKVHDFIDLCLEWQKQGTMKDLTTNYEIEPTVEVLAAQGWFFYIAGVEGPANAMHFTLLELASNPDVLKKMHEEIDKVFDECEEKLTYSDMEKMPYLDMVLTEAMRKYPTVAYLKRQCTKSTKLPVGGITVEKNCLVIIPTFGIHRDPKYYPNPEKFDPERFSPENIVKIPKCANLSFGEGSRVCIGNRLARLQVKAGLAWLLRKFTIRPQQYEATTFEPSFVAIKDTKTRYELLPRN